MNILIIGYGVVGKNMHKLFPKADIYDCLKPEVNTKKKVMYDVAFICVPTDKKVDESCDISIVEKALEEHKNDVKVFCIKSTVPPGTTYELSKQYPCIFSPEYFGGTQHANGGDYHFVILGGDRELTKIVILAYKNVMSASFKIIQTTSKTAELVKYMENSFLAMKVSFCCEFFRIAETIGVDYNELRELFIMDSRVNPSHTFVYEDHPFYDSHCLNKDIPAIIEASKKEGYVPALLIAMDNINKEVKKQYD